MKSYSISMLTGVFFFILQMGYSQENKTDKWDVNNPPGGYKDISFSVSEGTWMNLDVSPDGSTIVFDLLGDIYIMPSKGGKATLLKGGLAWEVQPRFSPDGKNILFTSDAGGGDNIWIMEANGERARQITNEDFTLLNNAVWMPDGQYFVARKHFTSTRSLGAGEMWLYHISGGKGIQLTKRKNDQQDVNEPSVSPDGRYVYFSEDMYPGGYFQYNKDPNSQIFIIRRYDMKEGKLENIVSGPGGAFRPQVSKDGKKIAYVKRIRTETWLCIHDLVTGLDTPLFKGLSKDQQEAWTIFGIYTGFAWGPNDTSIYIWGQGKIWQVPVDGKSAVNIPFEVEAKHRIMETLRFENKVYTDSFQVNVIRHARTSPDGQWLVFSAAGHLYRKKLPSGKPERITQSNDFEFEPSFSNDGKWLTYVTWDDELYGKIWIMDWGTRKATQLTVNPGIYRTPSFSPDNSIIVYAKESGNEHQGFLYGKEAGLFTCQIASKEHKKISEEGEYPSFNQNGDRIFYQTGGNLFGALQKSFKSIKIDGTDSRTHFTSKYANQFTPSPDNKWIAFTELHRVYLAAMPLNGQSIELTGGSNAYPVTMLAKDAGINLHWSGDGMNIHWTMGNRYFSEKVAQRFSFLHGKDSLPALDSIGILIDLVLPSDKPQSIIALKNARIITMEGDQVIENGTIIIENNRITAIGPSSSVRVPSSAKVYQLKGKTIMPGMVDVHGHLGDFRYGLSPKQNWFYYANLAYGVTTAHDPSSNSEMIFSHSEMIRAGHTVGPRLYSTGTILYGADGDFKAPIKSLDDALSALRRNKSYGAFSVKSYNQPRREQRQQVIEAARQLGMLVVPEGGSFFYHNLSMVADGHTGVEHNIPVAPLYKDVIQFWAATKTHNTPTLIVNYGSVSGEYYWYQHTNVWEKERLLRFTPRAIVDSRSRHRTMIPEEEYQNGHILTSQSCKKLHDAGVRINLGAHGQLQGLGAHWELWMLAQGGMTPMEAIRSATLNGAIYLGMDQEIGSLKVGKLADLIVIDGNPLKNIYDTENIIYTMVNGRLFDAEQMDEIGSRDRKRGKFYFEQAGSGNAFPLISGVKTFMIQGCACRSGN
jgi:imidazolonepropionase-like amidohydrolase/Tol biopolymer transport system component